jgi:hypothetical protein
MYSCRFKSCEILHRTVGLHVKGLLDPADEGTILLRNVDKCLSVDMANTSQKTRTFISTCGNLESRISIPVPQCMLHRWILLKISSTSAPAITNMNAIFYSTICFVFPSCLRWTDRGNFAAHSRINSAADRKVNYSNLLRSENLKYLIINRK